MEIGVKKAMNVGATLHNRECLLLPRLNERGSIQFHRGCTYFLFGEGIFSPLNNSLQSGWDIETFRFKSH